MLVYAYYVGACILIYLESAILRIRRLILLAHDYLYSNFIKKYENLHECVSHIFSQMYNIVLLSYPKNDAVNIAAYVLVLKQ